MLRQHHEESFAAPDSDVRDGSSDLVSLIWMKSSGESPSDALREYVVVASRLDVPVEFVLVNNGGPESELADEVRIVAAADMPVTVVHLHGRSPDSVALSAACRAAKGDRIATLPYYLQVSATKLSEMIERSRTEFDFVASVRVARVDGKSGQAKSWWFNRAVRWISGIELRDLNSGLKVFHRSVVDGVPIYGELHVYLPILAAKQGFRVGEVEVNHLEERQAAAGYGIYLRRALDLLTVFFLVRFTQRPFRFFGSIGTMMIAGGFVINVIMMVQRLAFDKSMADRPLLVLGVLLMALGVQVFSLGLLGELIIFAHAGGLTSCRVQEVLSDRAP